MKRKVLSVILTGAMVAGLAGTVTVHAEEQKTYNIGICQLVQHEALDAATQGFEDAVKEGLGEENVTFDEQNAQGDSATCSTIINNFVSSNVDLILANATASLQADAHAQFQGRQSSCCRNKRYPDSWNCSYRVWRSS